MVAYATVADVKASMDFPNDDRDPVLADLISQVSEEVSSGQVCGRSFAKDPASGTSTWTLDVVRPGMSRLSFATAGAGFTDGGALDIVSITTLEVRASETSSYETIASSDTGYYLVREHPDPWPYEDVILSPACTVRTTWPTGFRAVRITGVRGWSAVPDTIRRVVIDEVRERWRQGPGGGPSQQGVNQFGVPLFLTGDTPLMRRVLRAGGVYRKQSFAP